MSILQNNLAVCYKASLAHQVQPRQFVSRHVQSSRCMLVVFSIFFRLQSASAFVQESQERIRAINIKLQRLLDGYLEQDIEREVYRQQKAVLLSEKKTLEEKMARIEQKQNDWLEPALGQPRPARRPCFSSPFHASRVHRNDW